MKQEKLAKIEQDLRQIAEILILNGTLTECSGLINGKTGIAIFFFHYAKLTKNSLYEEYANDLIEEIIKQLHNSSPADYKTGIAGIAAGLNYMIVNRFLNADEDIFEDFDKRMYRAVMFEPWQDFSLYDGLTGYGRYWLMRLRHQPALEPARECLRHINSCINEKLTDIPEDEKNDIYCFLHDLHEISNKNMDLKTLELSKKYFFSEFETNQFFPRLGNSDFGALVRKYLQKHYFNSLYNNDVENIQLLDIDKPFDNMGILAGYTGEGLIRMQKINPLILTWMYLL